MAVDRKLTGVIGGLAVFVMAGATATVAQVPAPAAPVSQASGAAPAYSWMSDLMLDRRARRVHDLITVQITETIVAVGSADASTGKGSSAKANFPDPLAKGLGKFLPSGTETKFSGEGSTSRAASISAIMTARVVEQLGNGDLRIEGVREIFINGDRQVVTLSGVIRTADIVAGNVVSSAAVGDLRIQYFGRGLMKDNLSPGWLVRFLNKIF